MRTRGPHIDWRDVPLGDVPDAAIAFALGCSHGAVRKARYRLPCSGQSTVPNASPRGIRWDDQPLGNAYATDIARVLGVSPQSVHYARSVRGIDPFMPSTRSKAPTGLRADVQALSMRVLALESMISELAQLPESV